MILHQKWIESTVNYNHRVSNISNLLSGIHQKFWACKRHAGAVPLVLLNKEQGNSEYWVQQILHRVYGFKSKCGALVTEVQKFDVILKVSPLTTSAL